MTPWPQFSPLTPPTPPTPALPDPHWIEILDRQGLCPPWQLGPFAGAREAQRMARGVARLVNMARFSVRVGPACQGASSAGAVEAVEAGRATRAGQAPPALNAAQPQASHFSSDTASHNAQASISAR